MEDNLAMKTINELPDAAKSHQNGRVPVSVVTPEMCCYCFDVLVAQLTHTSPPKTAHFTNDE